MNTLVCMCNSGINIEQLAFIINSAVAFIRGSSSIPAPYSNQANEVEFNDGKTQI